MDEIDTPTNRRIGVQLDRIFAEMRPSIDSGGEISLEQMRGIFSVLMRGPEPYENESQESIDYAFLMLETISEQSEQTATTINAAMLNLTAAILANAIATSNQAIEREMAAFKGINARNKLIAETTARAREIASEIWKKDIDQQIRIGEMAQMVYAELHQEGRSSSLPKDADALRKWISQVAPSYSRRGGRSKKT